MLGGARGWLAKDLLDRLERGEKREDVRDLGCRNGGCRNGGCHDGAGQDGAGPRNAGIVLEVDGRARLCGCDRQRQADTRTWTSGRARNSGRSSVPMPGEDGGEIWPRSMVGSPPRFPCTNRCNRRGRFPG